MRMPTQKELDSDSYLHDSSHTSVQKALSFTFLSGLMHFPSHHTHRPIRAGVKQYLEVIRLFTFARDALLSVGTDSLGGFLVLKVVSLVAFGIGLVPVVLVAGC